MRASRAVLLLAVAVTLSAAGCYKQPIKAGDTVRVEMEQTEDNHRRLVAADPPPMFEQSLERKTLIRRLQTLNVQNKTMYIHCMSLDGKVIFYGPVAGKVSSLNSLLTTPEQIAFIRDPNNTGNYIREKLPSPDFDGSYGKNPEGIFWYSPDGGYHEWSGTYFLSDRPIKVNTPISLQATVDLEKK